MATKRNRRTFEIKLRHVASVRDGVMLIMALFFIVLATGLSVLIMANTAQLVRTTRNEHEAILLRQLSDSGQAWVRVHGAVNANAPVRLNGSGIVPESITGEVEINSDTEAADVVIVTAHLRLPAREVSRITRFLAKP